MATKEWKEKLLKNHQYSLWDLEFENNYIQSYIKTDVMSKLAEMENKKAEFEKLLPQFESHKREDRDKRKEIMKGLEPVELAINDLTNKKRQLEEKMENQRREANIYRSRIRFIEGYKI